MRKVEYNLKAWREALPKKVSKAKAARMLGVDEHAYGRYEKEGLCPLYIVRAAHDVTMFG